MGETKETPKANEKSDSMNVREGVKKFMQDHVLTLRSPSTIPSIYRVPSELRNGHAKFFEPISVPIGPLHYNEKSPAQELKKWCLKNFIARLDGLEEDSLDLLAGHMSSLVKDVRDCYGDINDKKVSDEELVKIMLLDGCFILEQFWSLDERYSQGNPFGSKLEAIPFLTLQQDLLKIENQLPFFVLKTLATLAMEKIKKTNKLTSNNGEEDVGLDLTRLALNFFNISKSGKDHLEDDRNEKRHLLELVMNALFRDNKGNNFPINMPPQADNDNTSLMGAKSASELEYYGIRFRPVESSNIANVRFTNGELKMPKLNMIREATLWNFLIFETLSCISRIVSSYVVLMATFINNEKDVQVFLDAKILVSHENATKTLLSMFDDMSATVNVKKNFCFAQLINDLNRYWQSPPRKLRALVVSRCYESRWELLNNVLLFTLTSTQTLFSVLGYNPSNPRSPKT